MTDDSARRMLEAALMHVPFDGWSETAFRAAAEDAGLTTPEARGLFPRGAVDMAAAWHRAGDAAMAEALAALDLGSLRYSERVARAVRLRIECAGDREAVRRGTTLFALPLHAAEGARLLWGTADAIWTALGDTSRDINWYTKRMTLSGVYSATLLYWLGDDSLDGQATWAFLDRRIADVMRFEKAKSAVRENRMLKPFMAGPDWLASRLRAPQPGRDAGLPGGWTSRRRG
jgi:ubiquinone biosynthesis protein COQ9